MVETTLALGQYRVSVRITWAPSPPPVMFSLVVVLKLTFIGCPEMKEAIPETSQLSSTQRLNQLFQSVLALGNSHTQLGVRRFRISVLLGPYVRP